MRFAHSFSTYFTGLVLGILPLKNSQSSGGEAGVSHLAHILPLAHPSIILSAASVQILCWVSGTWK